MKPAVIHLLSALSIAACGSSTSARPGAPADDRDAGAENPGDVSKTPPAPPAPPAPSAPPTAALPSGAVDPTYGTSAVAKGSADFTPTVTFSKNGRAVVFEHRRKSVQLTVLLPTGAPDTAHGAGGSVKVAIPGADEVDGYAIIDDDGSVLVGGEFEHPKGTRAPLVARIKNGQLDASFGSSGLWTLSDRYADVRLIVPERNSAGAAVTGYFALVRFSPVGDLNGSTPRDASDRVYHLSAGGVTDAAFGGTGYFERPRIDDLILDASGSPIVVSVPDAVTGNYELRRLTKTGSVDTSYGTGGLTTFTWPGRASWLGLHGGGFLASLYDERSARRTRIVRIGADGQVADAFVGAPVRDIGGVLLTVESELADGRLLLVNLDSSGTTGIERWKVDGSLDSGFGAGGKVAVDKVAGADFFLAAAATSTGATMLATTKERIASGALIQDWSIRRLTP